MRIPCSLAPSLSGATEPTTVVATARNPEATGGLEVSRSGDTLTVSVGTQVLGELATSPGEGGACGYRVELDDRSWSIDGGPDDVSLSGDLDHMPFVSGLFSALDVRSDGAPTIDVTTAVHDTRTTSRQAIAWIAAVAALLAALLLLAVPARPRRPFARIGTGLLGAARQLHLVDAVVGVVLAGWWIVAPVIWDDGWVVARERTFAGSGGFSTYYDVFGVSFPLDYWVEWLHHWVAERSSVVLDLRLHALLLLLTTWVLLRWAFGKVRGSPAGAWDAPLWSLASAFLVVALAWDMTIRPEPVTAVLATGVAACAIRFATRESVAPLALAALLVPLALTAHHTGIVALAPVLAISPRLARWVRHRWLTFAALLIGAASWGVVLLSVGSDVGQRLSDARTTSDLGITSPWRDELHRYVLVDSFPWATPLRRGSVALIALALLAFASRRRAGRLLDLPGTVLAVALVLLVLTPSKLAWHFGSLAGLLAFAIGSEVAGIREEGARARGRQVRPYLVIGAAILASAWSWFPRDASNPVDLRSLAWNPGVDASLPFSKLALALPVVVLGCTLLLGVARGARSVTARAPWRVAAWTIPMFAAPLILFTVAVLARDLQRTDGWTLTRQNLDSLVGRSDCGLADDVVASLPGSARALSMVGGPLPPTPSWVPPAPVDGLRRFALSSSTPNTPWFRLPADGRFGLFVAGATVPGDQLALQWGRQDGRAPSTWFAPTRWERSPRGSRRRPGRSPRARSCRPAIRWRTWCGSRLLRRTSRLLPSL